MQTSSRAIGHLSTTGIAMVSGFLLNLAYARILSVSDRGSLAAALHVLYLTSFVLGGGLERSLSASNLDLSLDGLKEVASRVILRRAKSVGLIGLVVACLGTVYSGGISIAILLVFAGGLGNGAFLGIRAAGLAAGNTWQAGFVALSLQLLNILAFVTLAAMGFGVWLVALAVAAITALVNVVLLLRSGPVGAREQNVISKSVGGIRGLAFSYSVGLVAMKTSMRADRLILPIFTNTTVLGRYVVPAAMAELMAIGVGTISEAMIPVLAGLKTEALLANYRRVIAVCLAGSLGMFAATFFALTVLTGPIFGNNFIPSQPLALALAAGSSLLSLSQTLGNLLAILQASADVRRAEVLGSIFAIPLYFLLIPSMGMVGAALAATLAYGVIACACAFSVFRVFSTSKFPA